jgi:hypothetical protein
MRAPTDNAMALNAALAPFEVTSLETARRDPGIKSSSVGQVRNSPIFPERDPRSHKTRFYLTLHSLVSVFEKVLQVLPQVKLYSPFNLK